MLWPSCTWTEYGISVALAYHAVQSVFSAHPPLAARVAIIHSEGTLQCVPCIISICVHSACIAARLKKRDGDEHCSLGCLCICAKGKVCTHTAIVVSYRVLAHQSY